MGVAQDQGAEGAHPVHVLAAVRVPDVTGPAAVDDRRFSAHRTVGADRAVHPARKEPGRLLPDGVAGGGPHAPSSLAISEGDLWLPARLGKSRSVECRLSVPRSARTNSSMTATASVS